MAAYARPEGRRSTYQCIRNLSVGKCVCLAGTAGMYAVCQSFTATQGIGLLLMLHGCHCRVKAHFVPVKGQPKPKTTILMKFDAAVLAREHQLLP